VREIRVIATIDLVLEDELKELELTELRLFRVGQAIGGAPRHPANAFPRGNRLSTREARQKWQRPPTNPVDEIDKLAKETLTRLKRREYVTELVGVPDNDGRRQSRRVEKVLDAARGNAIANLLRLRLECFGQFQAGEEMRRLQEEVEHMHKLLAPYTERRPR
jgi:hypothetical protein